MSFAEDHPILDRIHEALILRDTWVQNKERKYYPERQSECVEFTDPETDQRYEIVVREIDDDDEGDNA